MSTAYSFPVPTFQESVINPAHLFEPPHTHNKIEMKYQQSFMKKIEPFQNLV